MIKYIQDYIKMPLAARKFRGMVRKPAFVALKEAKSIGILADLRKPGQANPVIQFARNLHKMNLHCHLLLLVPEKRKELNVFEYERNYPGMPVELVAADEYTFLKHPAPKVSLPFCRKDFDILFLLETSYNYALEYTMFHTKARMYAGLSGALKGMLDFEISLPPDCDLSYLTENLLKYLQSIQSKSDQRRSTETQNLFNE